MTNLYITTSGIYSKNRNEKTVLNTSYVYYKAMNVELIASYTTARLQTHIYMHTHCTNMIMILLLVYEYKIYIVYTCTFI